MKPCALLFAFASILCAGTARTFTGVIEDNKCVGLACATMCPVVKDPVYTLQTSDRAWVLTNRKHAAQLAARYAGQKVTITGITRGNQLRIVSVQPAN
jgi:DeoR/GlpR family transcriptional regulator of sugar metabolism